MLKEERERDDNEEEHGGRKMDWKIKEGGIKGGR